MAEQRGGFVPRGFFVQIQFDQRARDRCQPLQQLVVERAIEFGRQPAGRMPCTR